MVLRFVSQCARTVVALRVSSIRGPASLRVRCCSGATTRGHEPVCYELTHRALLKLEGADTSAFLQGIITNDVTLLRERAALYAHLLNVQGRTLYDVILYRLDGPRGAAGVLLECDGMVTDLLLKHLKVYKIRRQVSISRRPDLRVWAVLAPQSEPVQEPWLSTPGRALAWEADPRTALMGWRLVLPEDQKPEDLLTASHRGQLEEYHTHRYRIGLPEGVQDLPPGVALPLESNLVYLGGISFSKGCYIGQELTARTHHTGVVRKRLLPVRLLEAPSELPVGAELQTQTGKPAGKHRAGVGVLGLSLVRMAHANETLTLRTSGGEALRTSGGEALTLMATVPSWWPGQDDA